MTQERLELREMTTDDLPSVLAIEAVSFSHPWREQDFRYSLEQETGDCVVALAGPDLVGYSVGFKANSEYHLADFAIIPERRRNGLGEGLLDLIVRRASDEQLGYMSLEVRISNQPAIEMYRKAGFHQVAIRGDYYRHPREDALVMLKVLTGDLADWIPSASGVVTQAGQGT